MEEDRAGSKARAGAARSEALRSAAQGLGCWSGVWGSRWGLPVQRRGLLDMALSS